MKKSSPLFLRLFFCAGILAFFSLSFPANAKDTNETPEPWTNSLGMKFVPVPGTGVLFSIWDTRVQDYEAFVKATGRSWEKPDFEQGPTHPAVMVSWDDAKAFCAWLTKNERSAGALTATQEYRLPTDLEWSTAVGLEKETGSTPEERRENGKNSAVYPWGTQWPPPRGGGNYNGKLNVDDFDKTSPVGSFAANRFGLYDMSGNAWQWCEDQFPSPRGDRVLRGGAWTGQDPKDLLSSFRRHHSVDARQGTYGFRCVLAGGGVTAPQSQSATATTAATPSPTPKSVSAKEQAAPIVPASTDESALKTLSVQAPDATAWALAPLDQSVPPDIRQHLTYLREDLLDEGKAAPKVSADAYKLGSQLCDNLIAALDERDQAMVGAGYRAAQADANTRVTSQSLEARRNYLMSWPQYAREKDERSEIQRQQTNNTVLVKESVKTAWFNRTKTLRKSLDSLYAKYRDALRNGGN